jgi:multicomponent Na+:H+ antiporter subunit D
VLVAIVIGTACTGGAVLRAVGRIFLGLGETPGEEKVAPSEEESEKANRPLWLMLIPVSLLLILALLVGGDNVGRRAVRAAARFIAWDGGASLGHLATPMTVPTAAPPDPFVPWLTIGLSLLIAAHDLSRAQLPRRWIAFSDRYLGPLFKALDGMHDGLVGDYVAWIVIGLALFSLSFAVIGS